MTTSTDGLPSVHKYGFTMAVRDADLEPHARTEALMSFLAAVNVTVEEHEAIHEMARTGTFRVRPSADDAERYGRAYRMAESLITHSA